MFVVGCERSGTTWVQEILKAHPAVVTGPESHAYGIVYAPIAAQGHEGWADAVARFDVRLARRSATGLHLWTDRDEFVGLIATASSASNAERAAEDVISAAFEHRFARARTDTSRLLVEKTPFHLYHAERILRRFEEASIVEVIRDGRDVCVSMQRLATSKTWVPATRAEQVERWIGAVSEGARVRSLPVARGRWHTVRFEDLKADPVTGTRSLFAFAGLPTSDELVGEVVEKTRFSNLPRRWVGPDRHRRRGEVGEWRTDFDDADRALFDRMAGHLLASAGYPA